MHNTFTTSTKIDTYSGVLHLQLVVLSLQDINLTESNLIWHNTPLHPINGQYKLKCAKHCVKETRKVTLYTLTILEIPWKN